MYDLINHVNTNKKSLLLVWDGRSKVFRLTAEDYNFVHHLRLADKESSVAVPLKDLSKYNGSDLLFSLFDAGNLDAEYLRNGVLYYIGEAPKRGNLALYCREDYYLFDLSVGGETIGNLVLVNDKPKEQVKNAYNVLYFFENITSIAKMEDFRRHLTGLPELEALELKWQFIEWAVRTDLWGISTDYEFIAPMYGEYGKNMRFSAGFDFLEGINTETMPIFKKAMEHWKTTGNLDSMFFAIQQFKSFESILEVSGTVN